MTSTIPTVVVTGATGFVGRYVVERLLQEPVNIKCLIRQKSDANSFTFHDKLSFAIGDITQPKTLNAALKDAWAVINVAGLREFWSRNKQDFYRINQQGAKNIFDASLKQQLKRVIQISTPLAFGAPKTLPFNEDTTAGTHTSDYGHSKYLGDQAGINRQKDGLPLSILYLAAVIGAGDNGETMEVRRALEQRMPALIGADTTYTYVYVRDAAEAIVRCLMDESTVGEHFLIGNQRATTRQYFNTIGDIAHVKVPDINIPTKLLIPLSKSMEAMSKLTGKRPNLPMDVLKTTLAGSLIFDAEKSEKVLKMQYNTLSYALEEAINDIQNA